MPEKVLGACICPHSSDQRLWGKRTGGLDTENGWRTFPPKDRVGPSRWCGGEWPRVHIRAPAPLGSLPQELWPTLPIVWEAPLLCAAELPLGNT